MDTPYTALTPTDDFGLLVSNLKYSATLAATTDTTLTIPGSSPRYKVVIKASDPSTAEIWFALNAAAAAPAGASFVTTTSELLPANASVCREVKAGDALHFFATAGSLDVSVVFYALNVSR